MYVFLSVCMTYVYVSGGQKRTKDLLELVLQSVVNCTHAGNPVQVM